jgi:hypothetical protein
MRSVDGGVFNWEGKGEMEDEDEGEGVKEGPLRRRFWTEAVARTWWVTSRGTRVVFAAREGLEKMRWAASGSQTMLNSVFFSYSNL